MKGNNAFRFQGDLKMSTQLDVCLSTIRTKLFIFNGMVYRVAFGFSRATIGDVKPEELTFSSCRK